MRRALLLLLLALLLASCDGTSPTDDAGTDMAVGDAGGTDLGTPDLGAPDLAGVDLAGCDEDGDGALSTACGGTDCDDHSALRAPGHTEVCDAADVDEDCDPTTFGTRDLDMDGYVDANCCNTDAAGAMLCGDDCADATSTTHPGATELCNMRDDNCNGVVDEGAVASGPEVCNGIDDNCNGLVDEGVTTTYFADADHDLFGSPSMTMTACSPPAGYVTNGTDCDDTVAAIHPGAAEVCDGLDNDCDGTIDPGCACTSGSSRSCLLPGRCAGSMQTCLAGTWGACSILPAVEVCDGVDDDCNGVIDDGLRVTCYADADGDGYAASGASPVLECPDAARPSAGGCPFGETNRAPAGLANTDCDDAAAAVSPAAVEVCNGIDDDCNGPIDDGISCP